MGIIIGVLIFLEVECEAVEIFIEVNSGLTADDNPPIQFDKPRLVVLKNTTLEVVFAGEVRVEILKTELLFSNCELE